MAAHSPIDASAPAFIPHHQHHTPLSADAVAFHPPAVGSDEHALESSWTFWYEKKPKALADDNEYAEHLVRLGSFSSVEAFWRHYRYLVRPDELPKGSGLILFRFDLKPMWETFPNGGCMIVRTTRRNPIVARLWEELAFAAVGELFEMPEVVGVAVNARPKEDILTVWSSDNHYAVRSGICEKMKQILHLDDQTPFEWKNNSVAMRDHSSFHNAKVWRTP